MARIITLTTDWHNSDYYTGAVKAAILSRCSDVVFVDITHDIESFSVVEAAFVLKSVYRNFPAGTIHLICVDSEPDPNGSIVTALYQSQYFICNNNGCTGLIFDQKPEKTIEIALPSACDMANFVELNVFSQIAALLCKDKDISPLGQLVDDVKRVPTLLPQITNSVINGEVIYIDSYENAITNITKQVFDTHVAGHDYEILINTNLIKATKIHTTYKQVAQGEMVCLFNSIGLLEIAVRQGKAARLFNLDRKSIIRIKIRSNS